LIERGQNISLTTEIMSKTKNADHLR